MDHGTWNVFPGGSLGYPMVHRANCCCIWYPGHDLVHKTYSYEAQWDIQRTLCGLLSTANVATQFRLPTVLLYAHWPRPGICKLPHGSHLAHHPFFFFPHVFLNKVLLTTSMPICLCIVCGWGFFVLYQQSCVVGTERVCPAKPQIFSIWSITGNICQPLA